MKGGCACGVVRYALRSAPRDPAWCHCRICQLNSGSPAMAFATVPAADLVLEAGEDVIRYFASSEAARRHFCGNCGTPLYVADLREPENLYVSLVTLDDPAGVPPGFHIFYAEHIPWAPAGDDLPRYDGFRRDPNAI
ncbi:GFA family protein [Sphingomonas sp. SUN019]|uniref:GFA family protein n=1 Tax=Sphingomonas sp. SUN019 TaxID=2937788 RepID=UPI002164A99E|nr:GFA family protein [Sphingomonas sp. SUN019]UVO49560.1 GFA family protein [Sphingomonas sp. SUN019]